MEDRLREKERGSGAEKGDAEALAAFLRERQRRGETAPVLAGKLAEYSQDTRKVAFGLLEMTEDEQAMQEALILFGQQIDHALESAIQPKAGDAPLPDRETILNSIEQTLTPAQAKVFLDKKEVHEPTLVLVPVTSTERYTEALQEASQIMEGSQEPYFTEFVQIRLNELATQAEVEGNKIKKWKFALTEGDQTFALPSWDNGRETHQQRIDRFNGRYASKNITRLDYPSYIALMNQGLRQGKPIDCKYEGDSKKRGAKNTWQYTLLNEIQDGLVGAGCWGNFSRSVDLREDVLVNQYDAARSRVSVVGEMIEI